VSWGQVEAATNKRGAGLPPEFHQDTPETHGCLLCCGIRLVWVSALLFKPASLAHGKKAPKENMLCVMFFAVFSPQTAPRLSAKPLYVKARSSLLLVIFTIRL
jgi:hypothetical protein